MINQVTWNIDKGMQIPYMINYVLFLPAVLDQVFSLPLPYVEVLWQLLHTILAWLL